jgi:hypothetical protein
MCVLHQRCSRSWPNIAFVAPERRREGEARFDGGPPDLRDDATRKLREQAWVKIASGQMSPEGEPAPGAAKMAAVQLLKETRMPIPATAKHARRVDYEHERAGTANMFMFTEPLAGAKSPFARRRRKSTGPWRWRGCWRGVARIARKSSSCATIATRTPKGVLRGIRTSACPRPRPPHRLSAHSQTRKLAEHRRKRAPLPGPPMRRGKAFPLCRNPPERNLRMVARRQLNPTRRRLANENRRRPMQTQVCPPQNQELTKQ